ncbi:F-box protein At5g07610-like [Rutidosis leptorrhynchoides]|uniref:F-box protein At5g07610-like n=1 Tax=Rutidosis leptorrhynchoides TaxID=125765 RepID=UPI003A9A0053
MPSNRSSLSDAIDKVCSYEDLVEQILLRLPVTSLLRFESVSKHWYSLISDSRFQLLRATRTIDPPSSLYAMDYKTDTKTLDHYIVPLDDVKNRAKAPCVTLNFDPADMGTTSILHSSCNGIISEVDQFVLYMYQSLQYSSGMTLAFDPSKSPYFKIVSIHRLELNDYQIGIYSSQTCTWKASCKCTGDFLVYRGGGVYWNNDVHWLDTTGLFLYFNLDEEIECQMQTSFRSLTSNDMFESRDHLLLVKNDIPSNVKIHELKRDYSGWFVKYHVELDQLCASFPKLVNPNFAREYKFRVLSIVLDEKEDGESFFILAIGRIAIRFNLVTNTFYQLYYFNASYNYNEMVIRFPDTHQFIPSLYKV